MDATSSASPQPSARELWAGIVQTPEIVRYFQGVFTKVGITVAESGEQFTVTHHGDRVSFAPGIDADVEFMVPLRLENVTNLVSHAHDGRFEPEESWRIIQVLFTPLTQSALNSPRVRRNWLRALAGVETLIHVHLLRPSGGDAACHTLAFAGDQWLVIPGLHGRPKRVYQLTPDQALEFQRQLYKALKTDTISGWSKFSSWYRTWRETCSTT